MKGGQLSLITNQYSMKLGGDLHVYYYDISISPEVMTDSYIIQGISRTIKK